MPLSPEQIELFKKLAGVFLPQAMRQRNEHERRSTQIDAEGNKRLKFVHYTSAEAALEIIKNKRLWMRNTTCMADYSEVSHGHQILFNFFRDDKNRELFISTLDEYVPGAATEAIGLFDQWWNPGIPNNIRFNTYITSFSEHDDDENDHGRLSMWRGFGGSGTRIALVFTVPNVSDGAQALNLTFSPVSYQTEADIHNVIREVIANIKTEGAFLRTVAQPFIVASVFNMLLSGVTCLKHKSFKEEREWRAVYSPKFLPSGLMKLSIKTIGGVPQPIYEMPIDESFDPALADLDLAGIFDRIIIGPTQYSWPIYEAFVDELKKIGVKDAESKVFNSDIPIRA